MAFSWYAVVFGSITPCFPPFLHNHITKINTENICVKQHPSKSVIQHIKSSFYAAYLTYRPTHLGRISILSLQMAKQVVDSLNACATNGSTASVISWNL